MSKKKKIKYSIEFIKSAIELAKESKISKAHVARELGINPNTLYTWIEKYTKAVKAPMEKPTKELEEEIKRLQKELLKTKQERDLLKKAAAYFAQHTE